MGHYPFFLLPKMTFIKHTHLSALLSPNIQLTAGNSSVLTEYLKSSLSFWVPRMCLKQCQWKGEPVNLMNTIVCFLKCCSSRDSQIMKMVRGKGSKHQKGGYMSGDFLFDPIFTNIDSSSSLSLSCGSEGIGGWPKKGAAILTHVNWEQRNAKEKSH